MGQGNPSQEWRVNYANSNILWHFLTAIIWHKLPVFGRCLTVQFLLCFIMNLKTVSKYKPPRAYFWRGDLTEGFLRYSVWGAYFRNFTLYIYRWLTVKQILSKLSFQIFLLLAMETLFSTSPHLSSLCLVAHKAFYVHSSSRSSWCFWSVPVTYSARRRPVGFGPRASYSHSCCEDRPQCPLDKVNFPCFWFL